MDKRHQDFSNVANDFYTSLGQTLNPTLTKKYFGILYLVEINQKIDIRKFCNRRQCYATLLSNEVLTDKMRQNFINVTNDFIQV